MSYRIKTLVVFDTNSLRHTPDGKPAYNSFSFGAPYKNIREFIEQSGLQESVTLGVPSMVIEELKHQKQKQYEKDLRQLKEIFNRMDGLPCDPEGFLTPLSQRFDVAEHIEATAKKYIEDSPIDLIGFNEEDALSMLKNMVAKVIDVESVKSPFRPKDAGFKDNVIWETLMHFEGIKDFDKIIFLTTDSDYKENCYQEFDSKWQRYLRILKDENLVISELQIDYANYIEYRKVYDYAQNEYFDGYLRDLLTPATFVEIERESLKIENYRITDHCSKVEMVPDQEGDFISPMIVSNIVIYTTQNGEKAEIPVRGKTILSDLEYMVTEETIFEPSIS
jgi:PIN domain-containing protein